MLTVIILTFVSSSLDGKVGMFLAHLKRKGGYVSSSLAGKVDMFLAHLKRKSGCLSNRRMIAHWCKVMPKL